MTSKSPQYLYSYKYDYHHSDLCNLESRQLFGKEVKKKVLLSNNKIDPTISPFMRDRLEIILYSNDYSDLLIQIENHSIHQERFFVEFVILESDTTGFEERRKKAKDIGYRIEGEPDYDNPLITYAICQFGETWYMGILKKHDAEWQKHKQKPCSFSNSINMDIAKALVSLASKGNKSKRLLDACCGVGTVMLEACFSGLDIEGCDINWKATKHARENLKHFGYEAKVFRSDVKDLDQKYDAAIIDLPYNLYSYSNDSIAKNIIVSASKLADRIIIVSISDISQIIQESGLTIQDFCTVEKRGKSKFTRNIWVCGTRSNN